MKKQIPPHLLTVPEQAKWLRIQTGTLYKWVSRDEIPYISVGRHVRFDLSITKWWLLRGMPKKWRARLTWWAKKPKGKTPWPKSGTKTAKR